jgi:nicotinamidase-related amidase
LGLWLQENEVTTLFFGGVNSDQCVWSTLIDAYFKGFDTVYMEDCSATTSPWYAEQMVRYNGDSDGKNIISQSQSLSKAAYPE